MNRTPPTPSRNADSGLGIKLRPRLKRHKRHKRHKCLSSMRNGRIRRKTIKDMAAQCRTHD